MQFGLYAPVPHVTVGSPAVAASVAGALGPLPGHAVDPAWTLAADVLMAADRSGFDIILFAERHLGADLEAWVLGSAMGPRLARLRSMIAVHPGLWHPMLIAKMASSLDRMSPARMCINLVTGWNVVEHRMFGGDALVDDADRYVRAEEFVDVLRGAWISTPFSYDGRFYKVEAAELLLKPAGAEPPEIFTASRSPRGLDMVAAKGDWWFLDFDKSAAGPDDVLRSLEASIAGMRQRAERLGRRVRFAFNPFVCCGPTEHSARERAERMMKPATPDADMRKFQSRIGPAMKAGGIGTPAQVRAQLGRFADLGIELLLLKFVPTVAEVEAIAADVISPMRRTGASNASAA